MAQRSRRRAEPARYPRTARLNAVLQQVVAEELDRLRDIDERLRLVTVTAIETDPDLRHARVYLASLPEEVAASLEEHRVRLQGAIGRQVRARRTPVLDFAADPAVAAAERIESVLRQHRDSNEP